MPAVEGTSEAPREAIIQIRDVVKEFGESATPMLGSMLRGERG